MKLASGEQETQIQNKKQTLYPASHILPYGCAINFNFLDTSFTFGEFYKITNQIFNMKKTNYLSLIMFMLAFFLINPLFAQDKKKDEKKDDKKESDDKEGKDKKKKKEGKIKPYKDIITEEAVSDTGLFIVHKVADKYYFELTPTVIDKEILVVSRVSGFVKGLSFGGAGQKTRPQQVIRWQKKGDKILLRSVSYNSVASHDEPIYKSVRNNNFEPIVAAYDIKTFGGDSTTYVIEVNSLFTTDIPMIGALSSSQRKNFGVSSLDGKRSMIDYMKAFPKNVEVRHIMTYKGSKLPDNRLTNTLSVEMNQSFIELPEKPMQPRYYDARVAYFSIQQTNYSSDEHKAAKERFITKWNLKPKDMEAFKRGELVEPIEPIVYYLDPGTPEEWRPYLKQGVEDW